jgi:hypothetical protein
LKVITTFGHLEKVVIDASDETLDSQVVDYGSP